MSVQKDKTKRVKIDTIRVGAITYDVKEVAIPDRETPGSLGQINYLDCDILVREGIDPQMVASTLLHESIHAILFQTGQLEHNEELVERLGCALVSLIQDNPKLISFVQDVRR